MESVKNIFITIPVDKLFISRDDYGEFVGIDDQYATDDEVLKRAHENGVYLLNV